MQEVTALGKANFSREEFLELKSRALERSIEFVRTQPKANAMGEYAELPGIKSVLSRAESIHEKAIVHLVHLASLADELSNREPSESLETAEITRGRP